MLLQVTNWRILQSAVAISIKTPLFVADQNSKPPGTKVFRGKIGMNGDTPINKTRKHEIEQLLACFPMITDPCDLDVLVFLYRHPRTLLTNEQLAAFAGYDMKHVARAIEAFIHAGFLERTQNPMHAARMYVLALQGPSMGGLKTLLDLASTRQGRRAILQLLNRRQPPIDAPQSKRRLHAIA